MNGRISVVLRIPVVPFKYRFISWNAINKAITQMSQALGKMELYSLGLILLDHGYQISLRATMHIHISVSKFFS